MWFLLPEVKCCTIYANLNKHSLMCMKYRLYTTAMQRSQMNFNSTSKLIQWSLSETEINAGAESVCMCYVCIINIHLVSFNLYLEKITMKQFSTRTKITAQTAANHTHSTCILKSSIAKELIQSMQRKTI